MTGSDLIQMGFRPGKWFKDVLAHINENDLQGEALQSYLDDKQPPLMLPLHDAPVAYHINIKAENEVEADNIARVCETMDILMRTPTVVGGVIMPDACPAGPVGTIPVGGVVAAYKAIHPGMHSADICCSVMLTNFGKTDPKAVLDAANSITHFGPVFRSEDNVFEMPEALVDEFRENVFLNNQKMLSVAKKHLGTQGDGNHFLYVGVSKKTGDTILVTHHGSRGVGANLYDAGMKVAEGFRKEISEDTKSMNAWIPSDSPEGVAYWDALQIVRKWTHLNHEVIHQKTCDLLSVQHLERYWNEHNFVFRDGDTYYHAKGATPLTANFMPETHTKRIIPLNMCQPILIVEGDATATNLGFAPHGAGRNISRGAHKRLQGERTVRQIFDAETAGYDVRFFTNSIDISELPSAYKDAEQVKTQIQDFGLAAVADEIMPYGCIMAGDCARTKPWKNKRKNVVPVAV
jgi:tRNA-splicing ligase RtcB (3'-phosphate/5'-hydroxy nucleic acid ligase)